MLGNEIDKVYMKTRLYPGNDVLELYNGLAQVRFAASKTNLISSVTNLVYDLPHYSKLRKLENV